MQPVCNAQRLLSEQPSTSSRMCVGRQVERTPRRGRPLASHDIRKEALERGELRAAAGSGMVLMELEMGAST
eukprot:1143418-Pelagomonas_calceolata.AAC.5